MSDSSHLFSYTVDGDSCTYNFCGFIKTISIEDDPVTECNNSINFIIDTVEYLKYCSQTFLNYEYNTSISVHNNEEQLNIKLTDILLEQSNTVIDEAIDELSSIDCELDCSSKLSKIESLLKNNYNFNSIYNFVTIPDGRIMVRVL